MRLRHLSPARQLPARTLLGLSAALILVVVPAAAAPAPDAPPGDEAGPPGMIWIPAGPVRMGQEEIATPVHDVQVEGFWIDAREVSNGQYQAFIEAGGYSTEAWWSPAGWAWRVASKTTAPASWKDPVCRGGGLKGNESYPVVGVSWWEADAYCRWAGRRLPTEAEWEKAAKGGCEIWGDPDRCDAADTPTGPWGDEISGAHANYWDSGDPFDNGPTPVGFYNGDESRDFFTIDSVSPYGLYDVVGNAHEWTSSRHLDYPYDPMDGREAPPAAMTECCLVVRGGSWNNVVSALPSAKRVNLRPHERFNGLGFRTAQSK